MGPPFRTISLILTRDQRTAQSIESLDEFPQPQECPGFAPVHSGIGHSTPSRTRSLDLIEYLCEGHFIEFLCGGLLERPVGLIQSFPHLRRDDLTDLPGIFTRLKQA